MCGKQEAREESQGDVVVVEEVGVVVCTAVADTQEHLRNARSRFNSEGQRYSQNRCPIRTVSYPISDVWIHVCSEIQPNEIMHLQLLELNPGEESFAASSVLWISYVYHKDQLVTVSLGPESYHTSHHNFCNMTSLVWSAQTWPYPVEQRNVVEQAGVGKGNNTNYFAELWTLTFRESVKQKNRNKNIVILLTTTNPHWYSWYFPKGYTVLYICGGGRLNYLRICYAMILKCKNIVIHIGYSLNVIVFITSTSADWLEMWGIHKKKYIYSFKVNVHERTLA